MTPRIALQLWSVREQHDADPRGVLERVAAIGYSGLEVVHARRAGLSVSEHRAVLDAAGLTACAMHCWFEEIEDDLDGLMRAAREYGTDTIVCSWVDADRRRTREDFEALGATLADAGARCARAGLRLGYHSHDFELAEFDGRPGMDWIWDATAPETLVAEVDAYWVTVAGLDPVAYIRRLGRRVTLLHCKDLLPEGSAPLSKPGEGLARFNAPVGEGVIDYGPIIAAAEHAEWLIVEQDFSDGDPYECARVSYGNVARILGAGAPA